MQNKYCIDCRQNTKQVFVESIWRCEECFNTHSEFLPHPESLMHEIALAGSQIIQYGEDRLKLLEAVERLKNEVAESNGLLRSTFQIASREGKETNWEAFKNQIHIALIRQHEIMYPKDKNETSNL